MTRICLKHRFKNIMNEQNTESNKNINSSSSEPPVIEELDAAGRSLSEALRISFIILKVVIIILIIAFLASGFKTVGSEEQALVLRFGKIVGVGEQRLLGPGAHWIFPYPIDEIVKIPVERTVNLDINSFWYYQTEKERLSKQDNSVLITTPLNPLRDGYSLTRGEMQSREFIGSDGSDYNIVHTKWQLTYQIDDPERFFRNVYVEDVKPGDIYFNVIKESITPLLQTMFEDAVVSTMVNYTIDEAISSLDRIPGDVKILLQDKLDKIESGIYVNSVQLTQSKVPRQVKDAFDQSAIASNDSGKKREEALAEATNTIQEAAGSVAEKLFAALHDDSIDKDMLESLWSESAGTVKERIAEARAYRTKVVKDAQANASYLMSLLPEYRKRPELVIQTIYLDAIQQIFDKAEEIFVVQASKGSKGSEIRVQLNSDPAIKRKNNAEEMEEATEQD